MERKKKKAKPRGDSPHPPCKGKTPDATGPLGPPTWTNSTVSGFGGHSERLWSKPGRWRESPKLSSPPPPLQEPGP